jgi:type I restriction enzyme M protein
MARKASSKNVDSTANIGFEAKFWTAADKVHNNIDAVDYRAENILWVAQEACMSQLQESAKLPASGKIVSDAMVAIERNNCRLKGVLPKVYERSALDNLGLVSSSAFATRRATSDTFLAVLMNTT